MEKDCQVIALKLATCHNVLLLLNARVLQVAVVTTTRLLALDLPSISCAWLLFKLLRGNVVLFKLLQ